MTLTKVDSTQLAGVAASVVLSIKPTELPGDIRLIFFGISTNTITTPGGWTKEYDAAVASTRRVYLFSSIAAAGDTDTTFNFSASSQFVLCVVYLRSQSIPTPIEVAANNNNSATSGTALTAPTLTTITDSDWLLTFFASFTTSASDTISTPTGMTLDASALGNGTNGLSGALHHKLVTPPGATGSISATSGVSAPWAGVSVAIAPQPNPPSPGLVLANRNRARLVRASNW